MRPGTVLIRLQAATVLCLMALMVGVNPVSAAKKLTGQEVLDRARKTFDALSSFRADMTEVFHWSLAEMTTENRGWMMYRSDDRFRLEFPNQKLIVDGSTLWRHNIEAGQLLIESYSEDSGVILPKQLLAGLSTHWTLEEKSEMVSEDSIGFRLDLAPKNPDSIFRHVTVWIDSGNWLVSRAVVDDAQGNRTEYHMDHVIVNLVLPDSLFQVSIPEGTETIDLR